MGNNPLRYTDPSGHHQDDWSWISGWDKSYDQVQNGNTCAVLAIASVLTFVTGDLYTQSDVQPTFPSTYNGIGVLPVYQEIGLNQLFKEADKTDIIAKHLHGTRDDILTYLRCDLPVIVNIAFAWNKQFGHAIVAVAIDEGTGQIVFYDPAYGDYIDENQLLSRYNFGRGFKTFDELLAACNGILGPGSLVTIQPDLGLPTYPILPSNNGGSGGNGPRVYQT